MKKNEAAPEELAENIYERLPWPKLKIMLAVGGLFLFSFLCYFSLPALIAQSVKNAIDAKTRRAPKGTARHPRGNREQQQ